MGGRTNLQENPVHHSVISILKIYLEFSKLFEYFYLELDIRPERSKRLNQDHLLIKNLKG